MKLKEQMQRHTKLQGKSPKTFETYWHWCSAYFEYCRQKSGTWVHPKDCGRKEIESWLTYLANDRHVSKNTQNLALQSVLYKLP
jgi:hypothetical protein